MPGGDRPWHPDPWVRIYAGILLALVWWFVVYGLPAAMDAGLVEP